KFNEAVPFSIDCEDQAEVDKYWATLIAGGGEPSVCGWLKDRFGLSWQVVPRQLVEYMESPDREAAKRATEAMLQMTKIDVEKLRRSEEHTSELQSRFELVCRLLLEIKKKA